VYRLLGGKVRDKVRVYNGGIRFPMSGHSPRWLICMVIKCAALWAASASSASLNVCAPSTRAGRHRAI